MRIDKALWYLRLVASRKNAQVWAESGHIRLGGRRITKASAAVSAGDVLTLPYWTKVLVIELTELPARRGPASEAHSCYRVLDERATNPIAGAQDHSGGDQLP